MPELPHKQLPRPSMLPAVWGSKERPEPSSSPLPKLFYIASTHAGNLSADLYADSRTGSCQRKRRGSSSAGRVSPPRSGEASRGCRGASCCFGVRRRNFSRWRFGIARQRTRGGSCSYPEKGNSSTTSRTPVGPRRRLCRAGRCTGDKSVRGREGSRGSRGGSNEGPRRRAGRERGGSQTSRQPPRRARGCTAPARKFSRSRRGCGGHSRRRGCFRCSRPGKVTATLHSLNIQSLILAYNSSTVRGRHFVFLLSQCPNQCLFVVALLHWCACSGFPFCSFVVLWTCPRVKACLT